MPEKTTKATLSNFWLTKKYPVDGRIMIFVWGVTAFNMEDAFRVTGPHKPRDLVKGTEAWRWNYENGTCLLEERSDQPEIEGDNFSVRDDRIKRRMPGQLNFGF